MDQPGSKVPPSGPLRVLHVEDDPNDVFLIGRAFRKATPEVVLVAVSDGRQAQAYLSGSEPFGDRMQHPLPDIVLLDLKLPKMTGLELLEWMKGEASLKEIPVFILSSSSEPSDVKRAHALGVNGYLSKQGTPKALAEMAQGLRAFASGRAQSKSFANRTQA